MQAATAERVASPVHGHSGLSCDDLANSIRAKVKAGDGHLLSAGVQLQEAKRRLPEFGLKWSAFLLGKCGLQTTRADELISIVEGRTTVEEARAKNRNRQATFAAKNKTARSAVSNGQTSTVDPRVAKITKILRDAGDVELTLWEAFANERLSRRLMIPTGTLN
jgi:hypothetical protein